MSTEKEKEALVDAPASTDDKANLAPPAYQQPFQAPGQPIVAQPTVVYAQPPPPPNDYLILSIINILCCFWPVGIFALLKSIQSRDHYRAGRYVEAEHASKDSLYFNKIGFGIGIAVQIFVWVMVLISVIVPVVVAFSVAAANNPTP